MSAINLIKEYIAGLPQGEPFTSNSLRNYASTENIRQILNRLVKAGYLTRVARGIFVKPEYLESGEEIPPSPIEIARSIASATGETILVHGAEAARQLQLSTQVPMRQVFYTSGNTRTLKILNRSFRLKHVNPSRLVATETVAGLVISALRYLGRENVDTETMVKIRKVISEEDFRETLTLTGKIPAWMADVFYKYMLEHHDE